MRWEYVQQLNENNFKRLTGVKRSVFDLMVSVVRDYILSHRKHPTRGARQKLCLEDQLLLTLMYYREYRTQFHIAADYSISEPQCSRIIRKIESILLTDKRFHLPGKKVLNDQSSEWDVVIVDVSESPLERPKKNSGTIIPAKRNDTP